MPYRNNEYKCQGCKQEYFLLKVVSDGKTTTLKIYCANEDCKFYQFPIKLDVKSKEFYRATEIV